MAYGYSAYEPYMNDTASPEVVDFVGAGLPDDPKSAAISVAFLLVFAALFLAVLKRSGFRAMVAIGRQ